MEKKIRNGNRYCQKCGHKLQKYGLYKNGSQKWYCPHCHNYIKIIHDFVLIYNINCDVVNTKLCIYHSLNDLFILTKIFIDSKHFKTPIMKDKNKYYEK